MNTFIKKQLRSEIFHDIKRKQPYNIQLLGINLLVANDVFPPDMGATTLYLAETIRTYKNRHTALDMGCGSGFLALYMRECGIPTVWATDIHIPAVKCTLKNIELNKQLQPVFAIESDLFSKISSTIKFDLIVFNHPYYPTVGEPVFGYNPDGGKEILNRFFNSLRNNCHADTVILLPFSSMTESEHDPATVVSHFNDLKIQCLLNTSDENGHHKIYEITFKKENTLEGNQ